MRYLYIEKKQRIETDNQLSKRALRIIEEFDNMGVDFQVSHIDDISVTFSEAGMKIHVAGENILSFTHIIFGGHHLFSNGYQIKRMIVDLVDNWNTENPTKKIKVQNSEMIKMIPFYDKLYMAKLCIEAEIPTLLTYYAYNGDYDNNTGPITYPMITKHVLGENDLVPIDGKLKIKKNVFLLDSKEDWNQERLEGKNYSDFLIQEFVEIGEDYRIFVANGEIIGGWKRIAPEGNFMTVTKGSQYKYYNEPSDEIAEICMKAVNAWNPDFIALDFILKDGKPYILELSLHPGFTAYETKCEDGEPVNIPHYIVRSL